MNEHEYALMRQVEDSYWWYAVLREAVAAEVKAQVAGRPEVRILDAGCGTGGMMETLRKQNASWHVSGVDYSAEALEHTRKRGFTEITQGSVDALPYPDATFDFIVCL